MTTEKLKEICEELRKENPYPPTIFIRPAKEDWDRLQRMCEKEGIRQDCFFAEVMALSYDNALHMLEKRMTDIIDSRTYRRRSIKH